jgi:DNA-binding MltR family transcriptional regulator
MGSRKVPNKDSPFEDLNRLQELTADLDERGLVLALAAFAEEALGDLLAAFMQPGEASSALLDGFNAPLGTFSARIMATAALGLITPAQQENLDRLRRIRNEFAHSWEPVSFSDQRLASHIAALRYSPLINEPPRDVTDKVRTLISALLTELRSTTHQIRRNGWSARTIGTHLIPGLALDTPNQVSVCARGLAEVAEELVTAKGERRAFLLAQWERWRGLLIILRGKASQEDLALIAETLAKFVTPPKTARSP